MRKSTLLMGLLLAAGNAFAADTYVDPTTSTAAAPKYYKIVSNRALNLKYSGYVLKQGESITVGKKADGTTDSVVTYPDTLWQNVVVEGQGTMSSRPYIGLYGMSYAAISDSAELVPDATLFWRFDAAAGNTTGKLSDGVRWVNLSSDEEMLWSETGTTNYSQLTPEGSVLYCLSLDSNVQYAEGSSNPYTPKSYVISNANSFFTGTGDAATFAYECFDIKNYCGMASSYWRNGYVLMAACWNPFSDFGITYNSYDGDVTVPDYTSEKTTNDAGEEVDNPWYGKTPNTNNGSVFYFVEATDAEVAKAKADLATLEKKILEEQGPDMLQAAIDEAVLPIESLANVPVLWSSADVKAAVEKVKAIEFTLDGIETMAAFRKASKNFKDEATKVYTELIDKADGTSVSFRNLSRFDTVEEWNEDLFTYVTAYKHAYLTLFENQTIDPETGDASYTFELKAAYKTEQPGMDMWTIEAKDGEMLLRNGYEPSLLDGAIYPAAVPSANDTPWATTIGTAEAGHFQIYGVTNPEVEHALQANGREVGDTVEIGIENVVAIGMANSGAATNNFFNLSPELKVVRWNTNGLINGSEFLNGSWWFISREGIPTAINDVTADKVARKTGTFDLQGRRVSTITRPGLYIIDGKKVLVNK